MDHGPRFHARRWLRAGFLRLGLARQFPNDGTQILYGMAGAHNEAADGEKNRGRGAERFDIIASFNLDLAKLAGLRLPASEYLPATNRPRCRTRMLDEDKL